MGWSYPHISLEDLIKLVKAFVDVLILASGYQSTGRQAHWDTYNIKKAFQWATFLQNVFKDLTCSIDYEDSIEEVDAALSELTSSHYFPQGLAYLSSTTLIGASDLIVKHLIHTVPLRESILRATLAATIEMDFDATPSGKHENWMDGGFSGCAIQEFESRQRAVLCVSVVQTALGILSKAIGENLCNEPGNLPYGERMQHQTSLFTEEPPVESVVWNQWRARNLLYMLDKRTMRLVSGASLIFSAPKDKWIQILGRLNVSAETDDDLSEIIELVSIGCIADRWSSLIGQLMSSSYESLTISKLYHNVHSISLGRSQDLCSNAGSLNSKEKSVLDYFEVLLSNQPKQLRKLPPIIAAVAIPSWSQLFRSFLSDLESQFRGDSLTTRCCSCTTNGMEHKECEVAERIWCLYVIHVSRSHRTCGADSI
ncbi:uncharacterized protein LOC111402569 isoform X1 [Olea europaea var. sylvestris]|uniref:Uncharacterized protein n=1 Tax=Olea europaea subsp. europaea TaxID=158383 RepID=A0A8S0P8M1_OLEEU|nr:uncharacterized protein LOC111402569 isoform X1 [Olea europaea var. sylvestris]XP_022886723.1 uncharacterized protein LOC111402569 isoform X1 [Olea europaea var. sylvestris]CAA2934057.1 Hypothetical predicted protein [Olea europaea subsp. europaea]